MLSHHWRGLGMKCLFRTRGTGTVARLWQPHGFDPHKPVNKSRSAAWHRGKKINKSSNPSCSHQREDGCTEWNVHIWPICFSFFYFSFISTWSSVPLTEFWNWVYVPVPNLWLLPHPIPLEKDLRPKMSESHVNPRKKCILKCSFSTSLLILVTYDSH